MLTSEPFLLKEPCGAFGRADLKPTRSTHLSSATSRRVIGYKMQAAFTALPGYGEG